MTGSSGRLARGASHQKCTASAHRGPTDFLSRSSCSVIAGESGLAGAAGWLCCAARRTAAAAHIKPTMRAQRDEVKACPFRCVEGTEVTEKTDSHGETEERRRIGNSV